jgi:hypothetical protein
MDTRILKGAATAVSGVLLLGAFTLAEAGVNRRVRRQEARIGQGVASGELTRPEYRRLERGEDRIVADKARMKADGKFTPRERARINRELNVESRRIYRQKHDSQAR